MNTKVFQITFIVILELDSLSPHSAFYYIENSGQDIPLKSLKKEHYTGLEQHDYE